MIEGDEPRARVDRALLEESADELYEQAPCGYLSTLPDGTIVRVNHRFVDWAGASGERDASARRQCWGHFRVIRTPPP